MEIQVGQKWYGRRPGAQVLIEVVVNQVTDRTVNLQTSWKGDLLFGGYPVTERYVHGEFEFIEQIQSDTKEI